MEDSFLRPERENGFRVTPVLIRVMGAYTKIPTLGVVRPHRPGFPVGPRPRPIAVVGLAAGVSPRRPSSPAHRPSVRVPPAFRLVAKVATAFRPRGETPFRPGTDGDGVAVRGRETRPPPGGGLRPLRVPLPVPPAGRDTAGLPPPRDTIRPGLPVGGAWPRTPCPPRVRVHPLFCDRPYDAGPSILGHSLTF